MCEFRSTGDSHCGKTADGAIDGMGEVFGDPTADWHEKGEAAVPTSDRTGVANTPAGPVAVP